MGDNNCLPDEMLLKIFQSFDPSDLKAAVLVCPKWREVGEDTTLWTWAVVKIRTRGDFKKLNIKRLGKLQEIAVDCECTKYPSGGYKDECLVSDLFKVIFKIPTVRRIQGLYCCKSISKVDPDMLVSVTNRLEKLVLYSSMTTEQLELLFRRMTENTHVKELDVGDGHEVNKVSPELFASAISNVLATLVVTSWITSQQMEALFAAITRRQKPLRKLKVFSSCLANIDPCTVGRAINRLEEFRTVGYFSGAQLTAILRILVSGESRLQKLWVESAAAGGLDPDLVERAKEKIGRFYEVYDSEEDGSEDEDSDD